MTSKLPETPLTDNATLYEQDYCLWIESTLKILREGNLAKLDIPNLIEEIEDMGISQKNELENNLKIVLMHLLKYKYQPGKRTRSWLSTLFEPRDRIAVAFQKSPSLKRYFSEIFDECYQKARKKASLETGLPLEVFPATSPFSHAETLNSDYWPD